MSKEVIIVTGGRGLVGWGVHEAVNRDVELQSKYDFVYLGKSDGDLTDRKQTEEIFKKYKPTYVIHCAARVGGLYANMAHKVEFYRENMLINDNVMECCRIFGVKRLVSCMTSCIFPDKTTYPIKEEFLHNGPPHSSNEGFAYAKRMMDVMNRCYREEYGCDFVSIIPVNIYGPHDNYAIENGHVIPSLLIKAWAAAKDNTDFVMMGTGVARRQFIYSVDLGRILLWDLLQYKGDELIIAAPPPEEELSIAELGSMICNIAGVDQSRIKYDTSFSDGQLKKTCSSDRLRAVNPEFQFTPIKVALKEAYDWMVENMDHIRK